MVSSNRVVVRSLTTQGEYCRRKFTVKGPTFTGLWDDDFQLWCLRMEDALHSRRMVANLTNEDVETESTDEALALMISAISDNPFRAVPNCTAAEKAWDKLQERDGRKP